MKNIYIDQTAHRTIIRRMKVNRPGLIALRVLNAVTLMIMVASVIYAIYLESEANKEAAALPEGSVGFSGFDGIFIVVVLGYGVLVPLWITSIINFAYIHKQMPTSQKKTILMRIFGLIVIAPLIFIVMPRY